MPAPPPEPLSPAETSAEAPARAPACPWLRRLGVAGFTFFLVKGLLWLILPGLLILFGVDCNPS